jgi:hypothetical protein
MVETSEHLKPVNSILELKYLVLSVIKFIARDSLYIWSLEIKNMHTITQILSHVILFTHQGSQEIIIKH